MDDKNNPNVISNQLKINYDVRVIWEKDAGIFRDGSERRTPENLSGSLILRINSLNNKSEKFTIGGVNQTSIDDLKFQFVPKGNLVKIRKSNSLMNQKNFVIDILEERGRNLLQNLDNKNWVISRKKINDNFFMAYMEEEQNNKKEQLFDVRMNYVNGHCQICFRENGNDFYLTIKQNSYQAEPFK